MIKKYNGLVRRNLQNTFLIVTPSPLVCARLAVGARLCWDRAEGLRATALFRMYSDANLTRPWCRVHEWVSNR